MPASRLFIVAALLVFLPSPAARAAANEIPAELRPFVRELRAPVDFVELSADTVDERERPFRSILSRNEALADIAVLRYLFDNAYSGRDYWGERGVDFPGLYAELEKAAKSTDRVDMGVLEALVAERLKGIRDGHLGLAGNAYHSFRNHRDAYFADVVLEKRGDRHVVVASSFGAVATGSVFGGEASQLFPTLSPAGRDHRLLGTLSPRPSRWLATSFDGKPVRVPLHRARIAAPEDDGVEVFGRYDAHGVPVIRVTTFSLQAHSALAPYRDSAKAVKGAPSFILDITSNGGGSSRYSEGFFMELGDVAHWRKSTALLNSPAIAQSWAAMDEDTPNLGAVIKDARAELQALRARPERTWEVHGNAGPQETGTYPGKAAVLINSRVMSSGEATIAYARSVKQSILIGENSAGVGTFGEVREFKLPHSGLALFLPSKIFLMPDSPEGVGFLPDLWLDSARPVPEVARWLARPETYAYLPPPPASLRSISLAIFEDGAPRGMKRTIGATEKEGPASRIELDAKGGQKGDPCLRLSADTATGRFYSVGVAVPPGVDWVRASWKVKGKGIAQDGHRFSNCWIGFMYRDPAGRKQFHVEEYDGTFDWRAEQLELDLARLDASDVRFGMFLSQSGDLWVDGLEFQTRPEL